MGVGSIRRGAERMLQLWAGAGDYLIPLLPSNLRHLINLQHLFSVERSRSGLKITAPVFIAISRTWSRCGRQRDSA